MGKKNKKSGSQKNQEDLLKTLGDFTSKENWDEFFTIRGSSDAFEWYAEWPQLRELLKNHLSFPSGEASILVPGCGNSKLSEHMYDAGFRNITNVDFSKVVITDMLKKNVRERPEMKWRVMDMTSMQFTDGSFNVIVDKGGLDALMEPKHGERLGILYLSEVKRLLKAGGKFICLTLAESHVMDLFFPNFRIGWKLSVYVIAQKPSSRNMKLQTFMLVAEKDISPAVSEISSFIGDVSVDSYGSQVRQLREALEREKLLRSKYSNGSDIIYSLEELNLGVKGDLKVLEPGRRLKLMLGEVGTSHFVYNCILLDAQQDSGPFDYIFAAFLVPKTRVQEWLFSSEEGQWLIVTSSKAARLAMIFMDSCNSNVPMEDTQADLSPLVKQLAPRDCHDGVQIPFMTAGEGIKKKDIVHQVVSASTGQIIVDDVIYETIDDDALNHEDPSKDVIFRRLIFQRVESLVQSEALLLTEEPTKISSHLDKQKTQAVSGSKKGKKTRSDSSTVTASMKVDHNYLASSYHNGIISGLMLLSSHLKGLNPAKGMAKAVVIGLGAGLLPMFMKNCLPSLEIEVVELDPVVVDIARKYFGFIDDDRLKINVTDGIKFVGEKADSKAPERKGSSIDILIVDVDSPDSTSGLTCPAADFVEESFLSTVKDSLSEHGLFVINLVSRSFTVKSAIYARLKMVFSNLFSLQIEEDVNEVIFGLKADTCMVESELSEARDELIKSLMLNKQGWSQKIIDSSKLIKLLR